MSYSIINCKNLVCKCEKKEVEKKIFIQCVDCIHGRHRYSYEPDCPCTDKIVKILVCEECDKIREKIRNLNYELDDALYHLSNNIRECIDVKELFDFVLEISIQLRQYDCMLREKL